MLVILPAPGLGELLTAVPALRALAAAFPGHRRVLAAPAALAPLAVLTGAVHDVVPSAPPRPLDPRLAACEVAVNLHGPGPGSHRLLAALRPARLIAFRQPAVAGAADGPEWREDEHEVTRWCRMLAEHDIPADPVQLDLPAPAPAPLARGATIVHPGAASGARRWPVDRFAAVARREHALGRPVLITGARSEAALAAAVAELAGLPPTSVLAGSLDVLDLARLVGGAARLVAGDTGVARLATALGTPSVVLFGPTDPARCGPLPERAHRHRALWTGRAGDARGDRPDPGLLEITVEQVLDALDGLPEREDRRARTPRRARPSEHGSRSARPGCDAPAEVRVAGGAGLNQEISD